MNFVAGFHVNGTNREAHSRYNVSLCDPTLADTREKLLCTRLRDLFVCQSGQNLKKYQTKREKVHHTLSILYIYIYIDEQ